VLVLCSLPLVPVPELVVSLARSFVMLVVVVVIGGAGITATGGAWTMTCGGVAGT
jgi:hypothetical protein